LNKDSQKEPSKESNHPKNEIIYSSDSVIQLSKDTLDFKNSLNEPLTSIFKPKKSYLIRNLTFKNFFVKN